MRGRTKEAEEFWKQVGSISILSVWELNPSLYYIMLLNHFLHYFGSLLVYLFFMRMGAGDIKPFSLIIRHVEALN